MILRVLGDLHLEFGSMEFKPVGEDAVLLAGDVHVGTEGVPLAAALFPGVPVLYVPGNHEYYGHVLEETQAGMRAAAQGTNVRVLDCDMVDLGGVRVLGCTLWTDFDLFGETRRKRCIFDAEERMNDFRLVNSPDDRHRFRPARARQMHLDARAWLDAELAKPYAGTTVVLTHHAPDARSIPSVFDGDLLNAAFASNLADFIGGHRIDLWVHGHTHHCIDYRIGATRVLSNQRGYAPDTLPDFDPGLAVDA